MPRGFKSHKTMLDVISVKYFTEATSSNVCTNTLVYIVKVGVELSRRFF